MSDDNIEVNDSDSENLKKTKGSPTELPPSQLPNTTDINYYRPNNALIKARILKGFGIDLPVVKLEGHNKSTKNTYWFLPDFTIKKSSRNVFVYYKRRWKWKINCPEDIKRANIEIENYLRDKLYWFSQQYTQIEVNQASALVTIKDFGLTNKHYRQLLRKSDRFHTETSKKVYPNHEIEHNRAEYVSNEVTNEAIKSWAPELAEIFNKVRGDLGGMIQQQVAISNAILLQTKILEDITKILKRGSFFDKVRRLWRKEK